MLDFEPRDTRLIRLLTRCPASDPSTFQRDWISIGARSVSRLPRLVRYGQNHALLGGYARGPLIYDGFEEFVFADFDAVLQALAHEAWAAHQTALEPLLSENASPIGVVRISAKKAGIPPREAIRSTEFVLRRPDLDPDAFTAYWLHRHGPLAAGIPQILRYEQHHLMYEALDAAVAPFDGWAATWFFSTVAMRESAAEPVYAAVRADEANFLAGPLPVLLTRERLSYIAS